MRDVMCQAKKSQTEQRAVLLYMKGVGKESIPTTRTVTLYVRRFFPRTGKPIHHQNIRRERHRKTYGVHIEKREVIEVSFSLKLVCRANGRRNYIDQRDVPHVDTKNTLLEQYRRAKKTRHDDTRKRDENIARIVYTQSSQNFPNFEASFAKE